MGHDVLIKEIVNEQFKMIGKDVDWEDIPDEGIKVKGKLIKWYDYYKFDNEAQYLEWKKWAKEVMKEAGIEHKFDEVDMLYGLGYIYQKEGQLF